MQTAVSVLLRIFNIILDSQHLNVCLFRKVLSYGVHVVAIIADDANAGNVEKIVAYRARGNFQIAALQLFKNRVN